MKREDSSDPLSLLARYVRRLRRLGAAAFLCTLANIVTVFGTFIPRLFEPVLAVFWCGVFGVSGLLIVLVFEQRRKEADALFEELSEDLHWQLRGDSTKTSPIQEKPEFEARVILKQFSRTSDLPLVPGRMGPAAYAAFNVALMICELVLVRGYKFPY